jgi:hypothetical protein
LVVDQEVVVFAGDDGEVFWAGEGVVEALGELGGDDAVVLGGEDGDGTGEVAQGGVGGPTVPDEPTHGEPGVVVGGDVG